MNIFWIWFNGRFAVNTQHIETITVINSGEDTDNNFAIIYMYSGKSHLLDKQEYEQLMKFITGSNV